MRNKTHKSVLLFVVFVIGTGGLPLLGQTHPKEYVKIVERINAKTDIPLGDVLDKRSNIRVSFNNDLLREMLLGSGEGSFVRIRVEAYVQRKGGVRKPIEVDNFFTLDPSADGFAVKYHDKAPRVERDSENHDVIKGEFPLPDSFINLAQEGLDSGDKIYLKITDVATQFDITRVVVVGQFGLVAKITDSFFLLKRLGVSEAEEMAGQKRVNFGPAPGVTFGWGYSARESAALKFLQPGFGFNVSFTDWNEPSFNPATGQFVLGTGTSKIDITTGPVFSLFDSAIQFTYGWNLNVRSNRAYFGVGFGFFKIVDRLGKLIKQ